MKHEYLFNNIKNKCIVIDIETSAMTSSGKEINIYSDYDTYLKLAKVKWFGAYSYKYEKYYLLEVSKNIQEIKNLLSEHAILIGFNSEEFDYLILQKNNFIYTETPHLQVDCMQILGKNTFKNKKGYTYKNRGELMNYSFKNNSLKTMAQCMQLNVQKGDIDYHIFQKTTWTPDEIIEIKKYLKGDIKITKAMFDKLWEFWLPFTDLLNVKEVLNLSWLKSSIASLTYKCACTHMNVKPTYSEKKNKIESMGGRVIMPKYEEANNVWYVDYSSLYPHIFCMFNLFAENTNKENKYGWHGNDVFKVKGYYYNYVPCALSKYIQEKLEERINLKKTDPNNPMIYAIKIFCNSLYGVVRSSIFEQVHTPNAGWDCCWLGQQINELTENMMQEFGFETIYGDTDSNFILAKDEKYNNRTYVQACLHKIIKKINENVPFPIKTFDIKIEKHLDYIMFPFSDQEIVEEKTRKQLNKNIILGYVEKEIDGKKCLLNQTTREIVRTGRSWVKKTQGKKKNYLYISNDEIELIGLPIKKSNATNLGIKIYNEILKDLILEKKKAKFSREFIENIINKYLKQANIMQLISQEYKVKPFITYKKEGQIQAQISKNYLNGDNGVVNLIKNNKVGKVGKGRLYCTVEEAISNNLTIKDLDLDKLWNELNVFIEEKDEITEYISNLKKKRKLVPNTTQNTTKVAKIKDITTVFIKLPELLKKEAIKENICDFVQCKQNKEGICIAKDCIECPKNNEQSVYEKEELLKENKPLEEYYEE